MGQQSTSIPCLALTKAPFVSVNVQQSADRKMSEQYCFPLAGPQDAAGRGPHGGVAAAVGLVFQRNGEEPTAGTDAKWVSRDPSQREAESTGEWNED